MCNISGIPLLRSSHCFNRKSQQLDANKTKFQMHTYQHVNFEILTIFMMFYYSYMLHSYMHSYIFTILTCLKIRNIWICIRQQIFSKITVHWEEEEGYPYWHKLCIFYGNMTKCTFFYYCNPLMKCTFYRDLLKKSAFFSCDLLMK